MKYYLGKGTELDKEKCKEYKTVEGALKAAAKDDSLTVWDENGKIIGGLTDNVPEGALETDEDGSVPAYDAEGNPAGTIDAETVAEATESVQENSQDEAEEKQGDDVVIVPQGKMRVTVICGGSLNLRRSPAWGNDNICGRATRGQSYYVKEIHKVNGKKMVRTIGDLYLSGESEHVQFEQL